MDVEVGGEALASLHRKPRTLQLFNRHRYRSSRFSAAACDVLTLFHKNLLKEWDASWGSEAV
jgi:hypothetical protein